MSLSLYQASAPVLQKSLGSLKLLLEKGAAHAGANKIDETVLLNMRLYPDMFPLARQVQIAADFGKGTCARLAGRDVPKYEDNETTFAQLIARIDRTVAFIASIPAAEIDGQENRDITLTIAGNPVPFKGQPYLLDFALPNFYFHMSMAYALLRHNGVGVGKRDFVAF